MEETVEDGIFTYRCYYKKNITGIQAVDKIIKLILYAVAILKMYRKAKRKVGKPDIIQSHVLLRTAFMSYCIGLWERRPYFILEHATRFTRKDKSPFKNNIERSLTRFIIKRSKGVIAVSQSLADAIRNKCNVKEHPFHVVYNCVDTDLFQYVAIRSSDTKTLVYVAEFSDEAKNISGLLQVMSALSHKRTDFDLSIIGYGKDEEMLRSKAEALGLLDRRVFFPGKKTGTELAKIMGDAEALLLFSNHENLPCVITEAFCCGTPTISTSVGGISEIVNEQNGILIPKGDEKAMLEAIEKVLNKEVVFNREKIAADASVLFSNQHIGIAFMKIYRTI